MHNIFYTPYKTTYRLPTLPTKTTLLRLLLSGTLNKKTVHKNVWPSIDVVTEFYRVVQINQIDASGITIEWQGWQNDTGPRPAGAPTRAQTFLTNFSKNYKLNFFSKSNSNSLFSFYELNSRSQGVN